MSRSLIFGALVAFWVSIPCSGFVIPVSAFTAASRQASSSLSSQANVEIIGKESFQMTPLPESVQPGVLTGQATLDLINHAKHNGYAIPAVNCVSSSSVNFVLEAAAKNKAPVMIQFSSGGAQFYAGKGLDNSLCEASIAGCVAGAQHVRSMAASYGVPVILHTDHLSKSLLPWLEGLLWWNEKCFEESGYPLFSSHMLDFSEEPLEENLRVSTHILQRLEKMGMLLEIELGITGGEEDGVNNSDRPEEELYTTSEDIYEAYKRLSEYSDKFTIAAAFGNVHGVYRPGNVKLKPEILKNAQEYVSEKLGRKAPANRKPINFVFHGGSGSTLADIREAISYGVVKMNIDTDTQWGYWEGIRNYEAKNHDYLQSQIGNPEGSDKPNKKFYDPRTYLRQAELSAVARLDQTFADMRCQNITNFEPSSLPADMIVPILQEDAAQTA
eukprot:Nitzschia sp. Nitz4//scaffold26_size159584//15137//16670//NITZ4_002467-RA/size159584-snap-gene-0.0-mRNA-1//1//CDS//3329545010//1722//frame0